MFGTDGQITHSTDVRGEVYQRLAPPNDDSQSLQTLIWIKAEHSTLHENESV